MQSEEEINKEIDEVMPLLNHKSKESAEEQFRRQADIARESCSKGRQFLSAQDYQGAAKQFSKAVMTFEYILKNNVKEQNVKGDLAGLLKETIRPSYSNLALCYVKLERWDLVISFADQIIRDDPSNTKNIYRRGLARKARKLYDQAIEDFEKVAKLDGEMEGECKRLVRDCKVGKKEQKIKQKELAKNFMSNYSEDKPEPVIPAQPSSDSSSKPEPVQRKDSSFWSRVMGLLRACCRRFS